MWGLSSPIRDRVRVVCIGWSLNHQEVPFWIVSICLSRSPFPSFHFFLLWEVDLYGPRVHNMGYISDPLVVWLLVGFQPMGHQQEVRGSREGEVRYLFLWLSCLYSHHMGCVPRSKGPSLAVRCSELPVCPWILQAWVWQQHSLLVPRAAALALNVSLHPAPCALELSTLGISSVSARTLTGASAKQPDAGTGWISA